MSMRDKKESKISQRGLADFDTGQKERKWRKKDLGGRSPEVQCNIRVLAKWMRSTKVKTDN